MQAILEGGGKGDRRSGYKSDEGKEKGCENMWKKVGTGGGERRREGWLDGWEKKGWLGEERMVGRGETALNIERRKVKKTECSEVDEEVE